MAPAFAQVIFDNGESPHDFLFFYRDTKGPMAVRHGPWKAHFRTAPGLGGCSEPNCVEQSWDPPLLFNIDVRPGMVWG